MTVEIQELVIQGRVGSPEEASPQSYIPYKALPQLLSDEERWIERIKNEIFEQLREQGWAPR